MRVVFAGVGDAFDDLIPNTSILVEDGSSSVLLDCGFTAAGPFWRHARAPLELGAVYLTHFHGDHFFGLPALLTRSIEEGRTRDLAIIAQPGAANIVLSCMNLAYPGTLAKARFALRFVEAQPGEDVSEAGFRFSFARNDHPAPCLSVRTEGRGRSLFYSGDGRPTPDTRKLAKGAALAIHEAYSLEPDTPGHGTVDGAIAFGLEAGCETLALVHIQRIVRRESRAEIEARVSKVRGMRVLVPEPGDELDL